MHEQTNGLWCASLAQVSSTAHQLSFKCERCVPGNPDAKKNLNRNAPHSNMKSKEQKIFDSPR